MTLDKTFLRLPENEGKNINPQFPSHYFPFFLGKNGKRDVVADNTGEKKGKVGSGRIFPSSFSLFPFFPVLLLVIARVIDRSIMEREEKGKDEIGKR